MPEISPEGKRVPPSQTTEELKERTKDPQPARTAGVAGDVSTDRVNRVKQKARALWQADGSPQGREQDYHDRAEQVVAAEYNQADPQSKTV
jgi:hypothetical protein